LGFSLIGVKVDEYGKGLLRIMRYDGVAAVRRGSIDVMRRSENLLSIFVNSEYANEVRYFSLFFAPIRYSSPVKEKDIARSFEA
jgi:hypothetical protein